MVLYFFFTDEALRNLAYIDKLTRMEEASVCVCLYYFVLNGNASHISELLPDLYPQKSDAGLLAGKSTGLSIFLKAKRWEPLALPKNWLPRPEGQHHTASLLVLKYNGHTILY